MFLRKVKCNNKKKGEGNVNLILDSKRIRTALTTDERSLAYHSRKLGISEVLLNYRLKTSSIKTACFFGKYLKINPKDLLLLKED